MPFHLWSKNCSRHTAYHHCLDQITECLNCRWWNSNPVLIVFWQSRRDETLAIWVWLYFFSEKFSVFSFHFRQWSRLSFIIIHRTLWSETGERRTSTIQFSICPRRGEKARKENTMRTRIGECYEDFSFI